MTPVMGRGSPRNERGRLESPATCRLSPLPEGWGLGRVRFVVGLEVNDVSAPPFYEPPHPWPLWQLHGPGHAVCAVAWERVRRGEPVTVYVVRPHGIEAIAAVESSEGLRRAVASIAGSDSASP